MTSARKTCQEEGSLQLTAERVVCPAVNGRMENNCLEILNNINTTMFRSARAKGEPNMAEQQQFPQLVSVARIVKLPVVETSWHLAAGVYTKIKKSNSLVSWGLNTAESSVQAALETTLPAVIVLERPIALFDSLLCKSLDIVEERVPVVTLPPDQILESTKQYVSNAIMLPVLRRADSVKQFGLNQANSAVLRLDSAISVADKYVDQYLPGTTIEENHEVNNFVATSKNNKALQTFHQVHRFSRKLQRRLTQHTVAEVKAVRHYSEDALRFVLYTAELLAKDPKALKEKMAALWMELSKAEPENQQRPANLEQLTVMVTRELARRVVHLVNYSREGFATLPQTISQSLHIAADYCTQLTDIVIKMTRLDGVKEVALARARIQVTKIQALLKEINEFTSQLLEHPLFTRHVQRLPLTHFRKRDRMLLNCQKKVQLPQPQKFHLLTENQRKALLMIQLPSHPPINFRKSSVYLI